MKKVMMMLALMAIPFAMQAQTKFHDAEVNEATGPVKSIKQAGMMGRGEQVVNFTQEGKMQAEGLSGLVYDDNGYLQKNGKVKSQSMDFGQGSMTQVFNYNDKGVIASATMDMMGQEMTTPFTDYQFDDHGNWISRKTEMMGRQIEQKRTIEYYE